MDDAGEVELPVALPGLHAVRTTTSALHEGIKEHYGVGRIECGDTAWWGRGEVWRSTPGCVLLKQPGDVVRHLAHAGATTYIAVMLPIDEVARVRDDRAAPVIAQLQLGDSRAAPFHRLLDAIALERDRFELEVALAEAIAAIAELGGESSFSYSRPVQHAIDYLRARVADSISLDDLADHAGADKFHLCRAFRAQVGLPPHAYLTHLRVARAKQLLRAGIRASDVAPIVGFCDQAQLTRHFHRQVGTTPARYGRAHRAR